MLQNDLFDLVLFFFADTAAVQITADRGGRYARQGGNFADFHNASSRCEIIDVQNGIIPPAPR